MSDRFDHVFIEPAWFDASLAFYRDTLGWTTTPRATASTAPG